MVLENNGIFNTVLSLPNFEIQKYYRSEPRFNGAFSRNNLPKKIKDGAYVINLGGYAVEAHIGLLYFVTEMNVFISIVLVLNMFLKKFVGNKNIKANIFREQANDSVMCGYFCIGFIDFVLAGKKLTEYTSLFSPHDFKKSNDLVLYCFKME